MCGSGADFGTFGKTTSLTEGSTVIVILAEVTIKSLFLKQDDKCLLEVNQMQEIAFFCKECRKGLRMTYTPCGCGEDIVLKGITLKCKTCTRTVTPKKYTESQVISGTTKDGKFFL